VSEGKYNLYNIESIYKGRYSIRLMLTLYNNKVPYIAGMMDHAASCQSGTGLNNTNNAGNCPVLEKQGTVRHIFIQYRTEMAGSGIPTPALLFLMLIPTNILWDNQI
jgi:hypothetical protein